MANKNTNKGTKVTTNNSIIFVTVNGLTVGEVIEDVKARLVAVEKSAFNIALECAYALGDTIPSHIDTAGNEHGEAICEKPMKSQKDLLELVGRTKGTLSKWLISYRYLVEKGYFSEFANGTLPFSYEKIYTISKHEEAFTGKLWKDLLAMSNTTLEALAETPKSKEVQEEEEENTTEQAEEDTTQATGVTLDEEEQTLISYNGQEYSVPRLAFEKWLSENGILNVTK